VSNIEVFKAKLALGKISRLKEVAGLHPRGAIMEKNKFKK